MPAYLIAQPEEIFDQAGLQEYINGVIPLMARFGGRYIITSFAVDRLEGDSHAIAAAVAEFPSIDQLRAFWNSPEYVPLKQLRRRSIKARIIAADVPAEGAP